MNECSLNKLNRKNISRFLKKPNEKPDGFLEENRPRRGGGQPRRGDGRLRWGGGVGGGAPASGGGTASGGGSGDGVGGGTAVADRARVRVFGGGGDLG